MITVVLALLIILMITLIFFCDLAYFQIPNFLVIGIFLSFFCLNPTFAWSAYQMPMLILGIGFVLSLVNVLGFGDSKLLAVLAFGFGEDVFVKLLWGVIMIGGLTALLFLMCHQQTEKIRLQVIQNQKIHQFFKRLIPDIDVVRGEIIAGDYGRYIPYGIPISLMAIYLIIANIMFQNTLGHP